MAEIGHISINVSLVITDETAERMCELLSDYLNEHWDRDLVVEMHQGEEDIRRVVSIVERE